MLNPRQVITALKQNIGKVIVGKDEVIELLLIAMLCKGHVLIEDVPGTGKTTLASALAKSLDCSFNRSQFTPDVVPSDVTGFTMVNFKTGEMEFHPGAIMCQIALADEINRTSDVYKRQTARWAGKARRPTAAVALFRPRCARDTITPSKTSRPCWTATT